MTLYNFLVFEKHYTEADAEETVIRFECFPSENNGIPDLVRKDIKEYYKKYYAKPLKVN